MKQHNPEGDWFILCVVTLNFTSSLSLSLCHEPHNEMSKRFTFLALYRDMKCLWMTRDIHQKHLNIIFVLGRKGGKTNVKFSGLRINKILKVFFPLFFLLFLLLKCSCSDSPIWINQPFLKKNYVERSIDWCSRISSSSPLSPSNFILSTSIIKILSSSKAFFNAVWWIELRKAICSACENITESEWSLLKGFSSMKNHNFLTMWY